MEKNDLIELAELAKLDQLERTLYDSGEISELQLWKNDRVRLLKTIDFLENDKIVTNGDCLNAAIIFQHGRNENNEREVRASGLAVKMMQKAIELDPTTNKWLLAAAIDRDLMIRNQPQIYGTQYVRKNENAPWEFYDFDSTKITDEERKEYQVETLSELENELIRINKKKLMSFYTESKDIDQILSFCTEKKNTEKVYDLSWKGISRFGFQLSRLDKEIEAVKVFRLLIQLYPHEFDPYHSLGVILVKLGLEEEAIQMFEKCLKLKPDFLDAQRDLAEILKTN